MKFHVECAKDLGQLASFHDPLSIVIATMALRVVPERDEVKLMAASISCIEKLGDKAFQTRIVTLEI